MNLEIDMPIVYLCSGELVPWHLAHPGILESPNPRIFDRLRIEMLPTQISAIHYQEPVCCFRELYPSQSIYFKRAIP